jgi:hypothetical protein
MPRKLELSYHATGQWKKKVNGKDHYFGKGKNKSDVASYDAALARYRQWHDEQQAEKRKAGTMGAVADTLNAVWTEGLTPEEVKARFAGTKAEGQFVEQYLTARAAELQRNRKIKAAVEKIDAGTEAATPRTISNMIDKFLARKKGQAQTGQKSVGRFANLESSLKHFREFVGADEPSNTIDAISLSDYYDQLMAEMEAGKYGDYSARDRLAAAKQFIRWGWEMGANELPRNIESRELTIAVTVGDPEPMPVESLKIRVAAATGRLKLELLLMANCGMTQVDTGDLLHTQIDWQAGTITRKRSKKQKGQEENLPTVTWYLWPSTLQLLREQATKDSPFVLATRSGERTNRDSFSEAGKAVRNDATGQSYRKFERKLIDKFNAETLPKLSKSQIKAMMESEDLELDENKKPTLAHWPPKHIRKTGSSAIGNHKEYSRYAQYFLGQAPESVADGHYVKPSQEVFKECCKWLGEFLELSN